MNFFQENYDILPIQFDGPFNDGLESFFQQQLNEILPRNEAKLPKKTQKNTKT